MNFKNVVLCDRLTIFSFFFSLEFAIWCLHDRGYERGMKNMFNSPFSSFSFKKFLTWCSCLRVIFSWVQLSLLFDPICECKALFYRGVNGFVLLDGCSNMLTTILNCYRLATRRNWGIHNLSYLCLKSQFRPKWFFQHVLTFRKPNFSTSFY